MGVLAAGLAWPTAPAVAAAATTIRGAVAFDATYFELDFASAEPLHEGAIPSGTTAARDLLLCAYAARGGVDAATPGSTDDRLLGCANAAATTGEYAITFDADAAGVVSGDDLYLLTWYCDGLVGGASLALPGGEVLAGEGRHCVRLNTTAEEGPWPAAPDPSGRRVKHTWSRVYAGVLEPGATHVVSWNLSCPGEDRWGEAGLVACAGPVDPWMPETCAGVDPALCVSGAAALSNSDAGWSREAIHVFRAAVQSRFFLADEATTVAGARPWRPDPTPTIELFLGPATTAEGPWPCGDRAEALGLNGERRLICLDGASLASPFVVLHEIGHLVHARWIDSPGKYGGGLECANPVDRDGDEIRRTNEGWSDFYAAAMWFDPGDAAAFWGRRSRALEDREGAWAAAIACPAAGGERREAQFFWDLYDLGEDRLGDAVDGGSLGVGELLAIWSRFTLPCGEGEGHAPANRHSSELGCSARNIADFAYHLEQVYGAGAAGAALTINCMEGYTDPGPALLCPSEASAVDPEELIGGCGCRSAGGGLGLWVVVFVGLAGARRRRRRAR